MNKNNFCDRAINNIYFGKKDGVPFIRLDPDDMQLGNPIELSKIQISILISKLTILLEE